MAPLDLATSRFPFHPGGSFYFTRVFVLIRNHIIYRACPEITYFSTRLPFSPRSPHRISKTLKRLPSLLQIIPSHGIFPRSFNVPGVRIFAFLGYPREFHYPRICYDERDRGRAIQTLRNSEEPRDIHEDPFVFGEESQQWDSIWYK